jgi:hypothetical protein
VATGALHVRVLKIPETIESVEPNYNGQLEMPMEGALLMSRRTGKEPIPIDFDRRDRLRHLAEILNEKIPGGPNCIHFLYILTFCYEDTRRQLPSSPKISTLDRNQLKPSDCMHLSPRSSFTIRFRSNVHSTNLKTIYTFPTSPAFLYYHLPPGLPSTAGEVRIRLTPGSDPKSFEDGVDLIEHDRIWRLNLVSLAGDARYAGICTQLLSDGFVTSELLSICRHLGTDLKLTRTENRSHILHSVAQEFFIRLSATAFTIIPVHRGTAGQRHTIDDFLKKNSIKLFAQGTTFLSSSD